MFPLWVMLASSNMSWKGVAPKPTNWYEKGALPVIVYFTVWSSRQAFTSMKNLEQSSIASCSGVAVKGSALKEDSSSGSHRLLLSLSVQHVVLFRLPSMELRQMYSAAEEQAMRKSVKSIISLFI